MKYKLKKPSLTRPLLALEHMYSDQGQLILKGAFYEKYYEPPYYDPYEDEAEIDFHKWDTDLEKEPIIYDVQVGENEYERREEFYIKFLTATIKDAVTIALGFFVERLESCNNLQDQYFVLYTLRRKIKKFKDYVSSSKLVPHRATQLKWIQKMDDRLVEVYEKQTGFVSFEDQKLGPKDVERIVGKLIAELEFSKDPGDLNKIVLFICSNNMTEDFGYINYNCPIWMLKEIIIKFQSFGFLKFKNVDVLRTEFFRKKGVPLNIDNWNSSFCSSERNRSDGMKKLIEAFK